MSVSHIFEIMTHLQKSSTFGIFNGRGKLRCLTVGLESRQLSIWKENISGNIKYFRTDLFYLKCQSELLTLIAIKLDE